MNQLLKKLRLENNKTQQEVAEILGYSSKSGYSMLENGNVELTLSKARVLADFYKVDPKIFFEI